MGSKAPTTTSTSTVPPQVLAQYQKVLDRANPIADTPYQPYTGQLTAGMNGLQNQALAGLGVVQSIQQPYAFQGSSQATKGFTTSASSLPYYQQGEQGLGAASPYYQQGAIALGGAQPYYGAAAKLANASAGPLNISQYFNPYTQNVIDATMANARRNDAIQQQGVISGAIGTGNAFGGDRMGVAQAELARNQDLANNQTIAGLESQNYSQALTAAQADQEREAQAASLLGGLGNSQISAGLGYGQLGSGLTTNSLGYGQLGNGLGNLGATMTGQGVATAGLGTAAQNNAINAYNAQMTGGTQAQQTDQNALNAQYQQWANSIAFPYQQLSWLSNISTGIGSGSGGTTTSTGSAPNVGSQLLGGALALGSFFAKRGGVVPYRASGGAVGVQSMFPPAGHAIDFSGVPGGAGGGLIPTLQINQARLNAPKAIDPNAGQADPIKMGQQAAGAISGLRGLFSQPSYGAASSAMGDPTGFGGLYRKGGVVGYADGGDVLDFDQRIAPAQLAVAEGDFNPQGDNFTTLDRPAAPADVPLPAARPQGLGAVRMADLPPEITGPSGGSLPLHAMAFSGVPAADSAISRTMGFEGGLNPRDTNGTPSNYGINQKANPDVDVASLTPDKAKELYRQRYWDAIGGDSLPPDLARVGFDTAVIAGPGKAKELIAASGGDPAKLLDLRQRFQDSLIAANPEKYGPYQRAWNNRIDQLRGDIGAGGSSALGYADAPGLVPRGYTPPASTGLVPAPVAQNAGSQPAGGLLGRMGVTEDGRQAMLRLGLGLLASRSPNFGTALGEAGLGAVSSMAQATKDRVAQSEKDREYGLQLQRLNQAAETAKAAALNQQVIVGPDGKPMVNPQYIAATKAIEDAKSYKPTTLELGTDPMTGNKKFGVYDPNKKTITTLTPIGQPTSDQAAANADLHGDDFLKSLNNPAMANSIKAIAEGRVPLTPRNLQKMLPAVAQYDPTFDAVNYNARNRAYIDASSGKLAQANNNLNTSIGHLGTLAGVIPGLHNTDWSQTVNTVKNAIGTEFGSTGKTNFDTVINRVAPEIVKLWRGAGGAEADIKRDIASLSSSKTETQLYEGLGHLAEMVESKLLSNQKQYDDARGGKGREIQMISPQSRKILDQLRRYANGERPGKPQADNTPTVSGKADYDKLPSGSQFIGSDGKRYQKP